MVENASAIPPYTLNDENTLFFIVWWAKKATLSLLMK